MMGFTASGSCQLMWRAELRIEFFTLRLRTRICQLGLNGCEKAPRLSPLNLVEAALPGPLPDPGSPASAPHLGSRRRCRVAFQRRRCPSHWRSLVLFAATAPEQGRLLRATSRPARRFRPPPDWRGRLCGHHRYQDQRRSRPWLRVRVLDQLLLQFLLTVRYPPWFGIFWQTTLSIAGC